MHLSVAKESFMTTQAVAHSWITTHTSHDCMRKKVKSLRLFAAPRTVAYQAPPSMEFSRQEYRSGLPFPSPFSLEDFLVRSLYVIINTFWVTCLVNCFITFQVTCLITSKHIFWKDCSLFRAHTRKYIHALCEHLIILEYLFS